MSIHEGIQSASGSTRNPFNLGIEHEAEKEIIAFESDLFERLSHMPTDVADKLLIRLRNGLIKNCEEKVLMLEKQLESAQKDLENVLIRTESKADEPH